ncbi:flavin reductase family protein [Microbacterium sp. G2-8]|uniref:flavin reductase family protein n=2 Tax=Micrococcales TaxID=85006 RepID=UPI001C890FF4|nr:iron-sulfur cluster-binding domain-containing protein [Microbacterium sp. G2-8]
MPWNRVLAASAGPADAASALGPWYPQEFQAECVETIPESVDMMTFVFRRTDGAPFAFRAGQYINVEVPVNGSDADPVSRSYSLSSAPTVPWTFAITVKRDEAGLVSPWMHDSVRPGTVLEMLGPVGAFHLPDYDRRARFLFLAAGSGITPLMSMIRTIHSLPGQADAILLYHGAAPDRFAFADELAFLSRADFRIRVVYALGDRTPPGDWHGAVGRISADLIDAVAPDANGRQVYACGPQGYLDAATACLPRVGVDDTSVYVEYFSGSSVTLREYAEEIAVAEEFAASADEISDQPVVLDLYEGERDGGEAATDVPTVAVHAEAEVPAPPEVPAAALDLRELASPGEDAAFDTVGSGALTLCFVRSRLNVRIDPEANILATAREAGIRIGANCQVGMCGSCKVVRLEGEVEMNHQGGIRAREIEAGKFLPCCSTARSDLVIDA